MANKGFYPLTAGGRIGWNVVTSMFDVEARNHGYETMPGHAERYRRADEFIQVVLGLWDSWADDALRRDRQGHPVLFQAGASEPGRELAARCAEAIYAVAYDLPAAQSYYRDIKQRVKAADREAYVPILRQLPGRLAAGGGHCTMVGTPGQIADRMEHWFRNEGADGFNLMPPSLPGGIEDFIEQVVPVLQSRGLFRTEYQGSTLREHLGLVRPGRS